MNTSFVGGLIAGVIVGVAAALVVMRIKQKQGLLLFTPTTVPIPVTASGVDKTDVLLNVPISSAGDKIQWTAPSGVTSFQADFDPNNSPFGAAYQFPSSGSPPTASSPQVPPGVYPGKGQAKCYKYSMTVTTSGGKTTFDPHVIIMGV
jgi:hypothetical protein